MSDFAHVRIDDVEAILGGSFFKVRAALGVSSMGMQVVDLPPNHVRYPTHNHVYDDQEEIFITLRGYGEIEIDRAHRFPLDADHLVRVGPHAERKPLPGDEGMRVLIVGGTPGTFDAKDFTELGAPDPFSG